MTKNSKIWENWGGPTQRRSDPRSGEGPRSGKGFPRRNMAEKENLDRLGFNCYGRGIATVHCSDPRARSDPIGESESKPGDARFISFYFSCY